MREFANLVRLMLDRADRAIDAGDAEAAHECIELARVQLEHTVREIERQKGAVGHAAG